MSTPCQGIITYGLPVKKATWLYAYGVELPELRWGYTTDGNGNRADDERPVGLDRWRDRWGGRRAEWEEARGSTYNADGTRCRPSNLGQTATTPPELRDILIATARTSSAVSEAAA